MDAQKYYLFKDTLQELFDLEDTFSKLEKIALTDYEKVSKDKAASTQKIDAYKNRMKSISLSRLDIEKATRRMSKFFKQLHYERTSKDWE